MTAVQLVLSLVKDLGVFVGDGFTGVRAKTSIFSEATLTRFELS